MEKIFTFLCHHLDFGSFNRFNFSFAQSILIGIVIIPLLIVPYFVILNARFCALVFASSEL